MYDLSLIMTGEKRLEYSEMRGRCLWKQVRIRECLFSFIQISQKDVGSLVGGILKQLEKDEINLQDCQSRCSGNAVVMTGHRSGVH